MKFTLILFSSFFVFAGAKAELYKICSDPSANTLVSCYGPSIERYDRRKKDYVTIKADVEVRLCQNDDKFSFEVAPRYLFSDHAANDDSTLTSFAKLLLSRDSIEVWGVSDLTGVKLYTLKIEKAQGTSTGYFYDSAEWDPFQKSVLNCFSDLKE